ncbi:hypothetical protein M9H77_21412 [Catharanthus roseus]|uniref:Uncharacterized protein n=1 Tax=Catharanthus roseus TaxID=4058 RepID=A0ACC0ANC9_CATRO|nr:hypothetical protein M9H77_21412 [Catharanthus roseus]
MEDPLVIRLEGSQSIQGCEFRNTDLMHEDVTMVAQGLLGCSTDLDLGRLVRVHKPAILILVETKLRSSEAQNFMRQTTLNHIVAAEVRGTFKWVLSVVYASLKSHLQDFIWEYLKEARRFIDCLWLLIGDWNQVLQNGGNQVCQKSCIPSDSGSLNFPWLAYSDRRWLNHVIGDHEIEVAIFQMSEHKATGLNGRSLHTIAWHKVYQPREKDGLGLPLLDDVNKLYLMSTEEDSPKFGLSASRKFGSKIVYDFLPRDGSEEADWRRFKSF